MDYETITALERILAYVERNHPEDHPDMIYKEVKLIEEWMAEHGEANQ